MSLIDTEDRQIPESRARHSRHEWFRNGFKGDAEAIYVVEIDLPLFREFQTHRVCAASVKKGYGKGVKIGLIVVNTEFHGRGIDKALVAEAIRHYQGKTPDIQTGTQAKNLRAIQLYTCVRFSIVRDEFSFHRHFRTIT